MNKTNHNTTMFFVKRKRFQDDLEDYIPKQPYLSGLLTGLAAGLAIGFLFAPRSGKNLRKQIAGAVNDQSRGIQHQWDKTKAQARETISTLKTNVGLATDKAEDEFNSYVEKAVKFADEAEKEADKAVREADQLANETNSYIDKLKNKSRNS